MFTTFIVQPIFNVLTLIYALIPGHNFGVAIILFTIVARIALYPMLKKQLKHTRAMRQLQPEIKKIKAKTKGNKAQESAMMMELYKEREIKPLSFMGLMVLQIVIFFALFSGLNKVVNDPQQLYDFSYTFIQNLPFMQEISSGTATVDNTLFGFVDLTRAAVSSDTGFYFPAFLLVLGSALIQFFQIKQTMPSDKDSRKLRDILKDANTGKQADNTEVSAAMTRNMAYIMPLFIFIVTIGFPAALSLYWFVGGLIAFTQQARLLRQDEYAMTGGGTATVVSKKPLKKQDSGVKVTKLSEESESNKPKTPQKTKKKTPSKKKSKKKKR